MGDSSFSERELAILYHHGIRGFIFNAERTAQKQAISIWKEDEQKLERLHKFNRYFDMSHIAVDTNRITRDYSELQPGMTFPSGVFAATEKSPFSGPGMDVKRIGDRLANDVAEYFEDELTRLLEYSALSKQQFIVFVLLWKEPSEYGSGRHLGEQGVADVLDVAVGTVRSHHGRAKKKIREAEFTAGLPGYAEMDIETAHEDTKSLLGEML